MIDVARALKVATETGDVRLGMREVRRALRSKAAKLVVLASNCPDSLGALGDVRVHRFSGTNVELGAACGVPFSVAAVAVLSPGESNILSL
ncbi:MAG: 50S ribosomal protein L30e [Methanobacteriota archaeon]